MKWYLAQAKRDFARFGFLTSPFTDEELMWLYKRNIKLDEAYNIGCDIVAGFGFHEAVSANTNK